MRSLLYYPVRTPGRYPAVLGKILNAPCSFCHIGLFPELGTALVCWDEELRKASSGNMPTVRHYCRYPHYQSVTAYVPSYRFLQHWSFISLLHAAQSQALPTTGYWLLWYGHSVNRQPTVWPVIFCGINASIESFWWIAHGIGCGEGCIWPSEGRISTLTLWYRLYLAILPAAIYYKANVR